MDSAAIADYIIGQPLPDDWHFVEPAPEQSIPGVGVWGAPGQYVFAMMTPDSRVAKSLIAFAWSEKARLLYGLELPLAASPQQIDEAVEKMCQEIGAKQ